jgi:phospholipase/carboxylesterase
LDLSLDLPKGVLGADLSAQKPAGIKHAAHAVRELLVRQKNRASRPFILGGFSQGAMVAAQVAFSSDEPLRALVLLSGTLVDETAWKATYARRKGLHVFISHGRTDPTLSFEAADRMRGEMTDAGILVTWFPFDGGHEIPAVVVVALNEFLAHLGLAAGSNAAKEVSSSAAPGGGEGNNERQLHGKRGTRGGTDRNSTPTAGYQAR